MKLIHNQQKDTLQINAITIRHFNDSNNKLKKNNMTVILLCTRDRP